MESSYNLIEYSEYFNDKVSVQLLFCVDFEINGGKISDALCYCALGEVTDLIIFKEQNKFFVKMDEFVSSVLS